MAEPYPRWAYFPRRARPAPWVDPFVAAISAVEATIDSRTHSGITSDAVLGTLRPSLEALGYEVETGKTTAGKLTRPVLFGDEGEERVHYEIDAFHPDLGVAVEVEAGRGAMSNAIQRDLIRSSLMVDAEYLALVVMLSYRSTTRGRPASAPSFLRARDLLEAIYASGRLQLPFQGVLLVDY